MMKQFYNTILSQTFSPCGNFLLVGDIYGCISVFHISRIVNPESNLTKEDQLPKNTFEVQPDVQVNSLLTTEKHLIAGVFGEIYGFLWKAVKTIKDPKPAWKIELPNVKDTFEKSDVNCLYHDKETNFLYAAGDNKIYVFNLEGGKLVRTLEAHTGYIHSFCKLKNDLISGGEDGVVNIWDLREKQPVNKIKPYENDKIARPELGKWIGAVNLNEDWLLCGGGPRLSLWHFRSLNVSTIFPLSDKGIHVAEFYNDNVFVGGRINTFYRMTFNGDTVVEIPTSSVSTYSVVHQEEPFNVLSIAGASSKIDICTNFAYKDLVLSLC